MRNLLLPLALFLTAPALAQVEVWVDPTSGEDTNGGTSPLDAYRTVAHALGQVQAPGVTPPRTVHLMPGTYGATSGESFPLTLQPGTALVSTDGSSATHFAPPVTVQAVFRMRSAASADVHLEGLSMVGGDYGVEIRPAVLDDGVARVVDVLVEGASTGIDFYADTRTVLENVEVRDCEFIGVRGLANGTVGGTGRATCELRDSDIHDNLNYGLVLVWLYGGDFEATIERSRIQRNAHIGLYFVENGHGSAGTDNDFTVRDCLIAGNTGGVISWYGALSVEGCTIADNGFGGVDNASLIAGSIVTGHSADVTGSPQIERSLIGDGSATGSGNLSGDPQFVDGAAGDYRLAFSSPCVDAGSLSASTTDVRRLPRRTDGDLDLEGRADMGALELQPLAGPARAAIGQPYTLAVQGPAAGLSKILMHGKGLGPFGINTPFGRLFLHSRELVHVASAQTTGGAPTPVPLAIPPSSAWAGLTIAVQALTVSPAAPFGWAWSNPVTIQIVE